jgi:hypothetical protein
MSDLAFRDEIRPRLLWRAWRYAHAAEVIEEAETQWVDS